MDQGAKNWRRQRRAYRGQWEEGGDFYALERGEDAPLSFRGKVIFYSIVASILVLSVILVLTLKSLQ